MSVQHRNAQNEPSKAARQSRQVNENKGRGGSETETQETEEEEEEKEMTTIEKDKAAGIEIGQVGPGAWMVVAMDSIVKVQSKRLRRRQLRCGHYRYVQPGFKAAGRSCAMCALLAEKK